MVIGICDDERECLEAAERLITDAAADADIDAELREYTSAARMLADISAGVRFDMIFLDIMMGAVNGLETARKIRETDGEVIIILVTSYADFMRQGYEVRAFRYVMKNDTESISRAFREACTELEKVPSFSFRIGSELRRVPVRDILYIESDRRQAVLHTDRGEFRFYARLDDINTLPGFIRIHRSYLVNPERVELFSADHVTLSDGTRLSVSDTYRMAAKKRFMLYM